MLTLSLFHRSVNRFALFSIFVLGLVITASGQDEACLDEMPGHVVRSVTIKGRWVPKMDLPLKRGDAFVPDKLRETRLTVLRNLSGEKSKFNSDAISLGKLPIVDVRFVRACGRKVPEKDCLSESLTGKCVDVEIRPFALTTDPVFLGSMFLPIPRSNKFSFLSNVPRALRILDPKFNFNYDEKLGVTPGFEVSTDLLSLKDVSEGEPADGRKASLKIGAKGNKSIGERFYNAEANLSFLLRDPAKGFESVGVDSSFKSEEEPISKLFFHRNTFRIGGHVAFNPALGLINRVVLSGGFARTRNHLRGPLSPVDTTATETSFDGRAIVEGRVANGFTRAAFWADRGNSNAFSNSYSRFATIVGYEKDIPISGHTIGVEALAGAGWASGDTPEYALFYGGNTLNNFLYQETNDSRLNPMPSGPLMRSFGKNQAGLPGVTSQRRGAHSYQHFNLNVSIPIPGLSRPLIPDEVVNLDPRITVRDLIDFAVNTGEESLSLNYQDEGMDEEDADKKAAKIFREIRPGVSFLTNYAKVYALKPIVMFDVARMGRTDALSRTRYSAGGGLQLTVVVAKFEAGYLRTLNAIDGDQRGNFVVRFVFQNLF